MMSFSCQNVTVAHVSPLLITATEALPACPHAVRVAHLPPAPMPESIIRLPHPLSPPRSEGLVHAGLRWREYLPSISSHPAYLAAERASSGSRPKELFEDVVEEVEEAYEKAKVGGVTPGVLPARAPMTGPLLG